MQRLWAVVERDWRRFRRTPVLIVMSMVMPVLQLVIVGYAFGGNVRHLAVGVVDQDRGMPAVELRAMANAVTANAAVYRLVPFPDRGQALEALRAGTVNGVLTIPPGFSRRKLSGHNPHVVLVEDNTDAFVSATLSSAFANLLTAYNQPAPTSQRMTGAATLETVELYPYVPYIQFFLPGTIVAAIFMMVMAGGGIVFVDDRARGLHEGYLVTPVTQFELIAGLTLSGALKALLAGLVLTVAGAVVAGIPDPLAPLRLLRLLVVLSVTSFTLVGMMFLMVVRVKDPVLPRTMFGVLNMLLWFPSGAVYPVQGFPAWMRAFARIDPLTYAVHALKSLLLKNTGFAAIGPDLLVLILCSVVSLGATTLFFKRTL